MTERDERPIAIVGGGFSGALLAINLARRGARVLLIERSQAALAKGLAFGTRRSEHLLNVRASNMSAFPDDAGHFLRWMGFSTDAQANRFVPRLAYGQYLRELLLKALADSGGRLGIRTGDVLTLDREAGGWRLRLSEGGDVLASGVVLAMGNLPPRLPAALKGVPPRHAVPDPWAEGALAKIGPDDPVLLVGTGLTAVDVLLSLGNAGHRGLVLAVSRRGLRPRAHAAVGPVTRATACPEERGAALVRAVRLRAKGVGWRQAVDDLRPHTRALWQAHDRVQQARFLRHLRAWWDVHRHRLAPSVNEQLAIAEQEGRIAFRAGRLVGADAREGHVAVHWKPRGEARDAVFRAGYVVNCTGPEGDIAQSDAPLLRHLLAEGLARADPHRLGLDVDARCHVLDARGQPTEGLYAIGPLTKGATWEIVAVPDIRHQVWQLAWQLTARRAGGAAGDG